jgi:hypothetical protein
MATSGHVSLIFRGNSLDFGQIERTLNITASSQYKKGNVINRILGNAETDIFIYKIHFQENSGFQFSLKQLLLTILPHKEFIRKFTKNEEVQVRCSFQSELAQIYFDIPSEIHNLLSSLNLDLAISVFSWGGAEIT